jgi:hypothetical protein
MRNLPTIAAICIALRLTAGSRAEEAADDYRLGFVSKLIFDVRGVSAMLGR